jgi:hypothetical protein
MQPQEVTLLDLKSNSYGFAEVFGQKHGEAEARITWGFLKEHRTAH